MTHILFLDFDGVLHPEFCAPSKYFCQLPLLEEYLRSQPEISIVISSTWRLNRALAALKESFSANIADRIIGVTPKFVELSAVPDTLAAFHREAECDAWLRQNRCRTSPWVALDDRSWLFRPFSKHLVLTDGSVGLTAETVNTLRSRLQ
jgi:HAD domain in Swiss Army Knife RNA repair proteins